jgi:predicted phage terminase large subunit-like protein
MLGVRGRYVEDKASGTGLIQAINRRKGTNFVKGIQRDRDKVSRAAGCTPSLAQGLVVIPKKADWVSAYLLEFSQFTPLMNHKHDDQIDPTLDAIEQMLIVNKSFDYSRLD